MACSDYNSLTDPLNNTSTIYESVICPYTSDLGAGMGLEVFALFTFGLVGLGLTIRTQHPGPIVVAGILTAGTFAASVPGSAARIAWFAIFIAIVGLGYFLYQRGKRSL